MIVIALILAVLGGWLLNMACDLSYITDRTQLHWRTRRKLEAKTAWLFVAALVVLAIDGGFVWYVIGSGRYL